MRAVRVLERILAAIPIMLGVAVIVFVFMRLTPGDPVDIMMGEAGYISEGEIENIRWRIFGPKLELLRQRDGN